MSGKDVLVLIVLSAIVIVVFLKFVIAVAIVAVIVAALIAFVKANRTPPPNTKTYNVVRTPSPPTPQVPELIEVGQRSQEPKTEKVNWHTEFKKKLEHEAAPPPRHKTHLSYATIQSMEWFSFEQLCIKYFECRGIRAEKTSAGPDGGVDIVLYNGLDPSPYAIVQCKTLHSGTIGVKVPRELYGVMASMKVSRGMLMANTYFSEETMEFAKKNSNLKLVSGYDLWDRISELPADRQQTLERFLSSIDYMNPTCPHCEIKLLRRPGKGGTEFWGCPNYGGKRYHCRYTLPMNKDQAGSAKAHVTPQSRSNTAKNWVLFHAF